MKKIFTRLIITCIILMLSVASGWASGKKDYYSKGVAHAVPSGKGTVYVRSDSEASTSDEATATKKENVKDAPTHTYYFLAGNDPTGYTWKGWYDTEDHANTGGSSGKQNKGAKTCSASVKATENSYNTVNRYARWMPNTYYVAFNGNGNTSGNMDNQTFTYDADAKALTANGFTRAYTVSYDANGGTTAATTAANTTATYTFDHWNTEANNSGQTYGDKASVQNLATSGTFNLHAQWNSASITLPDATKNGSVLDAWYNGDTRIGAAGEPYTPTTNVKLTAHWINKYTPEFSGSDHNMKVGDVLENAFTFNHVDNPTAHVSNTNVISYDAATNKVTALSEGTSTIYFTQDGTNTIVDGKSATWTFTVSLNDNTLALVSTSATKCVDEEVTGVIISKNSDATVNWSSTDETIATYDVANNKIVIPNSQSKLFESKIITIKIWQEATAKYAASGEKTITLTVTKKEPIFTLDKLALELEQTATLSFENTSGASVVFSKDGVVSYNANTGIISAVAVGETKMTVTQQQTRSIAYKQQEFNITVSKKTPTLIVKMGGAVQTNNEMSVAKGSTVTVTFEENSDADVVVTPVEGRQYASYVNGVMTAGVVGTAKYCASVAETATYQAKSVEFSLTVTENANHLPISGRSFVVGSGDGTNWEDKYEQIDFEGIPNTLSFDYTYDYWGINLGVVEIPLGNPTLSYDKLNSTAQGLLKTFGGAGSYSNERKGVGNKHLLYIEASADNKKWHSIWEDDDASTKNTKYLDAPISLPDTIRHLRFHHSCNFKNTYSNISITERKKIETPAPSSIDFGKAVINSSTITKEVNVNWCNVAPVQVTSSDSRIKVTPSSFGNFEQSGSQTLTLSYTPASTDETFDAAVTLSNGDNTYNKTISVKAATVRRPQTITWDADLKATGYAMNVGEQYPDANMPIIATATNNGRITFTTADPTKIEVIADTALRAKAVVNKIKIAAHQAGDAEYQAVHDTVEFTVTNLQKQSITWNQNLRGLLTTSDTVHLKARASSGMKITYTSGNTDVVKITNDSVLEVVGEGKTYITAYQPGKEGEWLGVSQDNYVIVRNPNAQCDETAVYISEITLGKGYVQQLDSALAGIPEQLTFQAMHGEKSSIFGGVSYSNLKVEQYSKRNEKWGWNEVFNKEVSTKLTKYGETEKDKMILDESATKIRFSTLETGTTHTIKNIEVSRKSVLSADVQSFDEQVETGAIWEREIAVTHSNIDVLAISTKKNLLNSSVSALGEGCGSYGDDAFTVSFTPQEKYTDYYDTIVITDGKVSETHTIEIPVHLYSKGLTQAINDFNAPATALSTDANITLSATASSEETVKFATSDTTKARIVNGNELEIVAAGTVKVYAMQAGNAKYDSVAVEKTLVISKVTPVIAENEKPAAENVRYNGTWDNSLLTGGVARVTWRGVADTEVAGKFVWSENVDETITNIPNTYNRSVTFKPKDSGKFNEVTFTMPVNVQRAVSSIAVDNKTIIVSLPEESVNFDLSTLVSEHIGGGNVTFDFTDEVTTATINGVTFTPSAYDEYAIRATIAQTDYYTSETTDFTVSVIEGILFDGTNTESLTSDDPIIINSNVTIGYGESVEVKALTINGGNTLTIANGGKLTVGADNSFNRDVYGNIVIEAGGKLVLSEGKVLIHEFTLHSGFNAEKTAHSGQVINQSKLILQGDDAVAYFILDLDRADTASYGWYDFSVPFPVDALHGITRWQDNDWMPLTNEVNYAVMAYNEAQRARTSRGWKKYTGILQPGTGYTITPGNEVNRYRFEMVHGEQFVPSTSETLTRTNEGAEIDRGWNSVGNGTMQYVDVYDAPAMQVQMYDHNENAYHNIWLEQTPYSFAVGAAYFVQAIEDQSALNLVPATQSNILRAPQRSSDNDNCRFSLSLKAGNKEHDLLIISCDDDATNTYTVGKDVQKMGTLNAAKVGRLWTNAKGADLCAYNAAFVNGQAIVPLSIFAPAAGEYTISLNSTPAEEVYLRRNGIIIWNMEMGDYFADFAAGTDNSYDLLVIRHAPNTATGIDAIDSENDKNGTIFVEKIIVNDQLYILRDGTLYDAQGRVVTNR